MKPRASVRADAYRGQAGFVVRWPDGGAYSYIRGGSVFLRHRESADELARAVHAATNSKEGARKLDATISAVIEADRMLRCLSRTD